MSISYGAAATNASEPVPAHIWSTGKISRHSHHTLVVGYLSVLFTAFWFADFQCPPDAVCRSTIRLRFRQFDIVNDGGRHEERSKRLHRVFGHSFDTSGWLGMSQGDGEPTPRGFPSWATIPATQNLANRCDPFFLCMALGGGAPCMAGIEPDKRASMARNSAWFAGISDAPRDILDHLRLPFSTPVTTTACRSSPTRWFSFSCFRS